jgi:hypothetical protein
MPFGQFGQPMPPAAFGAVAPTQPAGGVGSRMSVATFGNGVGSAPASAIQKPYANYTPPAPISPYLNLFRNTGNPGINNYYTLVRPMLEQQAFNQQVQAGLQAAELNTRLQQLQLQQLQQQQNQMLNRPSGASFMNFQQYYPGLKR